MKTIVAGNRDILKRYKYFECSDCGWVGKADKDEYSRGEAQLGYYYTVVCPICNKLLYSINNEDRLNEIKNIEKLNNQNVSFLEIKEK